MMKTAAALIQKKTTPDAQSRAALRHLCQTDLMALLALLNRARPQNQLTIAFHGPLCEFFQTTPHRKNLYLLARGHFKTSAITCGGIVQRILRDPQRRNLIASNKAENAQAMLEEIKGYLADPLLLWAFPDILYQEPERQADKWTRSEITVQRPFRGMVATVETIGVEGELTSKHYDHGTFDDIVGLQNSLTREQLLNTISWARQAESLIDAPDATFDFVGTPWHYADYWAWLLEQKARHGLELGVYVMPCWTPAGAGDPAGVETVDFGRVRAVFPERFPVSRLLEIREAKGYSEFAAQYLLDPISSDTAIFPRARIRPFLVPRAEMPRPDTLWCAMTVDPAISTKKWADEAAIAVGGFDATSALHLLDLRRGKYGEKGLIDEVYDAFARTPGIKVVGIEAIAFAKLYQSLFTIEGERRGWFLPIIPLTRETRITKAIRIKGIEPFWGRNLFVADDCLALEAFLDEADRFRMDRESTHDDLLDAVADLLQVRARPPAIATPATDSDVDPELLARWKAEETVQTERLRRGHGPLDRTSLRVAASLRRYQDAIDEQRELAALGAGKDEFWG